MSQPFPHFPTFFLHRAVSELNRRLEALNKEAEAKRLQGRGGQSTKPFVQRYNTFASSGQPVRHLTPAVEEIIQENTELNDSLVLQIQRA
jgi:hypothetical protein